MSTGTHSSSWKNRAILVELSRTVQNPCSGELLFAVPSILNYLEDRNPGHAADDISIALGKDKLNELATTIFPSCQESCQKHFATKATPKTSNSVLKLLSDLLDVKDLVKADTSVLGAFNASIRTTGLSSGTTKSLGMKRNKRTRKRNKRRKGFGKNRSLLRNSGASSVASFESEASTESKSYSRTELVDFFRNETITTVLKEYKTNDIQICLAFILSSFHNLDGFIPQERIGFWLELTCSAVFLSRKHMLNHITNDLRQLIKTKSFVLLVLDEIIRFIWRNSINKSICGEIFGSLLFLKSEQYHDNITARRLFNRILYSSSLIFPSNIKDKQRIWSDNKEIENINNDQIIETNFYLKNQLINFYKRIDEKQYIIIIDQLFELFKFKDIAMGVFNKYDFVIEEWKEKIRVDVTAEDLANLDLNQSKKLAQIKDFRARDHKSSGFFDISTDFQPRMENAIKSIENDVLNTEVDFNEKLRMLVKKFLPTVDKSCQKSKDLVFNSHFFRMVEASTRLAIQLEVLNLVRKPIKDGPQDVSGILFLNKTDSDPHLGNYPEESSYNSRVNILCDIYLDNIESLYHGYVPFILYFDGLKDLVVEKQDVGAGSFRSFIGSVRVSTRPNSAANGGKGTVRGSGRGGSNRVTTRPTRTRGKLHGDDRRDNNNLLGRTKAKRDTRNKKTNNKTGSLVHMRRPRKDLYHYFMKVKDEVECFSDDSLLGILSEPEQRFKTIEESFRVLKRNVKKKGVVAKKASKIVKLVRELQKCLKQERRAVEKIRLNLGEEAVKNKVTVDNVFVED